MITLISTLPILGLMIWLYLKIDRAFKSHKHVIELIYADHKVLKELVCIIHDGKGTSLRAHELRQDLFDLIEEH